MNATAMGAARRAHPHPGIYPKSCEPRGWSASMVVLFIQSLLGMRAAVPLHLLLDDPHLPPWLPDLRLEGIRVGPSVVDLAFWRTGGGETRFRGARRARCPRAAPTRPPESEASLGGRARAALASLVHG